MGLLDTSSPRSELASATVPAATPLEATRLRDISPQRWRPWIAAVLQTGVNLGVLFGALVYYIISHHGFSNRSVFLVGVLPALLVFWIRRAVPESPEWTSAKLREGYVHPRIVDLFQSS